MRLAFVALALSLQGMALAQDANRPQPQPTPTSEANFDALVARIQDFQQRHSIEVYGADNPAAVPRGMIVRAFFARFRMIDDDSFAQYALEQVGASGADVETLRQAKGIDQTEKDAQGCSILLTGSLADADGLAIANYIVAAEAESDREAAVAHQQIIDRLSRPVRTRIEQGIDDLARGMVGNNLDHLGMAREDPELYKIMVIGYCRGRTNAVANQAENANGQPAGNVNVVRHR